MKIKGKFEALAARISSGSSSSSIFQPSNHSHSDHFNSQSSILWSQDPNHYKEVLPIFGSESASTDQSDRELAIRGNDFNHHNVNNEFLVSSLRV